MYGYKSPIGPMVIFFDVRVNGYALGIKNLIYGHYHSAAAAADDVYLHVTGCDDWDELDGEIFDAPSDIHEWEII